MLSPRWRKVWRDLWGNKVRTVLVILSIAIGVFAIGMIVATQVMLEEDLSSSYTATDPASAILFIQPYESDLVDAIRRLNGVKEAEGRRSLRLRLQVGPDEWKNLKVEVLADYDDIRLNRIAPVSGAWPPVKGSLLLERAGLGLTGATPGDRVTVEAAGGRLRSMPISGLAHDLNKPPAQFTGEPLAYITLDTLEWLGFSRQFDELHILVDGDQGDKEHIQRVADLVEARVEKSGHTVYWTWIPEPGRHPANDAVQSMLLILGVLGLLSLFASSFLVINIINGLLAQHTQHIGIMKAIGGRRNQIVRMYLVTVVIFGLMALILAIPTSGLAAYAFTGFMANLINFDLAGFRIPRQAILVEVAVAILVPLLAAIYPVFKGTGISVREAISEYGLGQGHFGASVVDRAMNWMTSTALALSRPLRISLRNTIRRKGRLLFTLFTLTLGGAIFIGILSVHASLLATLDDALAYFNYDVEVNFARPHRLDVIQREALRVPGVVEADSWVVHTGRRLRTDGTQGPNLVVFGTQAKTNIIQPVLVEGRWLEPDDTNAAVFNTSALREEPDVRVGDTITLSIDRRESEWQVVGIVKSSMTGPFVYANRPYLGRVLRQVDRASGVQLVALQSDAAYQANLARLLKEHFDAAGMQVHSTETISEIRETIEYQFNIIVAFLAIMAVLIALVGGLGLMGTMSINVLERTREIGVMRAVGASDDSILRIVMVEGIFVGVISWVLGSLAAYPIGKLLSDTVGNAFMQTPLTYVYATGGAFGWLLAILVIAAVASYLPARNASRLSVRETLAYE
jgi:putative ABC transport system permease protein